jgi:hypothetical protein
MSGFNTSNSDSLDKFLTTKGDLITHDGVSPLRLPDGDVNGMALLVDSNQPAGLRYGYPPPMLNRQTVLMDDFMAPNAQGELNWSNVNTGTGFAYSGGSGGTSTANGVIELSTGTTAASSSMMTLGTGQMVLGGSGNTLEVEYLIRVIYGLSNSTDRYQVWAGLGGNANTSEFSNGIYIMYDEGTDGQFWVFKTASGGTRSKVITTVPVTLNTWTLVRLTMTTPTQVSCYVSDATNSQTVTLGTNIPTTSLGPVHGITKLTGTASRGLQLDWFSFRREYAAPRYNV